MRDRTNRNEVANANVDLLFCDRTIIHKMREDDT